MLRELGHASPQASTYEWLRSGVSSLFVTAPEAVIGVALTNKEDQARIDAQSALEFAEKVLSNLEQDSSIVKKNRKKLELLKQQMAGLLNNEQLLESFLGAFKSIETDADEITEECIAFLDKPKTAAKFTSFLNTEMTNMLGFVNSFALIFGGDTHDFFSAGVKFGKRPEFDERGSPRSMDIANQEYIFAELKRMFRVVLDEVSKEFPGIDVDKYLGEVDRIKFSPRDEQSINRIRNDFDEAIHEIYEKLGVIFQTCLQSIQSEPTSANIEKFFSTEISATLYSANAPGLRRLVTIANGDCGPHTVVLSLLYGGIFGKIPRGLAAQILLDWYCMYSGEVRADRIGGMQLSDADFKAFLIEYLSVKSEADILKFSRKYFSKTDNLADNITPFLTRCARKAAKDYYNNVTLKEHTDSLGFIPEEEGAQNIDESESFEGLHYTNLEHTRMLLWKLYNIPVRIQGYSQTNPIIETYGDTQFDQMYTPLVWTRQGKPNDDRGHYIFAFDPAETRQIGVQDNSRLIEHLRESEPADIYELMSPVAVAMQGEYPLSQAHIEQEARAFAERQELERVRLRQEQAAREERLTQEQARLAKAQQERIAQELAAKELTRIKKEQARVATEITAPKQRPTKIITPVSKLRRKKQTESRSDAKKLVAKTSNRSREELRFSRLPERVAPADTQISMYGPRTGTSIIPLAYTTFRTEENMKRNSDFYIKKSDKDATKHDVFVKAKTSDLYYTKKVCTLSESTEPGKIVTAEFNRRSANAYYNSVEMMLLLAKKKIEDEGIEQDSISITIPNLSTREQAQQFFLAYYKVFGASIDISKQRNGEDPFTKYLRIEPAPDAQKAFHRLFSEQNTFKSQMAAKPEVVMFLTGKDNIDDATIYLNGALACFATHLGYQAPGTTHLSSQKDGPNQNFFGGYTHKPGWF